MTRKSGDLNSGALLSPRATLRSRRVRWWHAKWLLRSVAANLIFWDTSFIGWDVRAFDMKTRYKDNTPRTRRGVALFALFLPYCNLPMDHWVSRRIQSALRRPSRKLPVRQRSARALRRPTGPSDPNIFLENISPCSTQALHAARKRKRRAHAPRVAHIRDVAAG